MENIPPLGPEPTPQPQPQQYAQPPYVNPPSQPSGFSTGQILIFLAILLVGGGIIFVLSRSKDDDIELQPTITPRVTQVMVTSTPTPVTGTSTLAPKTATPNPTQTPTTVATFLGRWSGRFNGYAGCSAGNVVFDVFSNGTMEGVATTDTGVPFAGGGNVTAAGNISGGWVYGPARLNLTGKLLAGGTGSGTFSESSGCSGTFSVRR